MYALAATKSPQGIQLDRRINDHEVMAIPGNPGVTFARGDRVAMSNGVLILATDSLADTIGTVAKSVVCPAATVAFPVPGQVFDLDSEIAKTLVDVIPDIPTGCRRYKGTFTGHTDDQVAAYAAVTRSIQATTGQGADDRPNGAYIYIYSGTGAGQVNVIEDYDHTGGNVELEIITHRVWGTAPSTDSLYIVVAGEAATNKGIGPFGRIDLADEDALSADDGADDGNFVVVGSFHEMAEFLKQLTLPVVKATEIFTSP